MWPRSGPHGSRRRAYCAVRHGLAIARPARARASSPMRVWALARAQPHAGTQEFLRIDGFAVDPRFIMQMRSGGAAGRANLADHLSDPDGIADLHVDLREMAIARRQPVAVIDLDHAAIAAGPSGRNDLAVGGSADEIACLCAKVETGVHGGSAEKRIAAHAEAGGEFDFA